MSVESLASLIGGGTGALAVMAIFLTLILSGKLHTDGEFDRLNQALKDEKEAHKETIRALTAANDRAGAAVQAASLIGESLAGRQRARRGGD